jgi:hypothetical protein
VSGFSHQGAITIVEPDGHISWQYDLPADSEANDVWLLPNGHVVFAYRVGVREVTVDKQTVWDFPAPSGAEIQGCQPLPEGGFLIGESHDGGIGYLRTLDQQGHVQKTVTVEAGVKLGAHGQFREVRKTPQGTYLVDYVDLKAAREVDDAGKVLREFPCGSFVAVRLPNQNTLIACGDAHRVIEVDAQGATVWQVGETEIAGNQLGFAAGVQRLPNGNTIICNWPGHGGLPPGQPQAFELTPDKRVVWTVNDPALKWLSNLEVVDSYASPILR